MTGWRLKKPPAALRRAKLDNLALVPGSLLPFKEAWQKLANELPEGTTLIILPAKEASRERPLRRSLPRCRRGVSRPGCCRPSASPSPSQHRNSSACYAEQVNTTPEVVLCTNLC